MRGRREHRPVRTCCGCGARDGLGALRRFAAIDGSLRWDTLRGRGGWIHLGVDCERKFVFRKPWIRSLRLSISKPDRERLVAAWEGC